jgi:hypothetical protein
MEPGRRWLMILTAIPVTQNLRDGGIRPAALGVGQEMKDEIFQVIIDYC